MIKVRYNEQLAQLTRRCEVNLRRQDKNRFLGMTISKQSELEVQRKMQRAGFQEFGSDESDWPSLYLSSKEFEQSPYHNCIRLDLIEDERFAYKKEVLPANQLFNVEAIQMDTHRELNDWMKLRALDEPIEAAVLWQDDDVWMLDAPSEANTIDPCAKKAKGNVCTFGLGIGYFVFMATQNPEVSSITVVESSSAVINMFQKHLLPQFPNHIPIRLVEGNAYDYFNKKFLNQFDYVFVDIHKSNEDGLDVMRTMLQSYVPPLHQVDFWIEDSCVELMPSLIFHYLKSVGQKKKWTLQDRYLNELLRDIDAYFKQVEDTIETEESMKFYMYDRKTIRNILGRHQL